MRKLLFVLVLLFAAPLAHAQKFISSSGGVLAVDCLTGTTSFKTTVFEAITSVSIVNAVPGETITIIFQQDATGHSVTFGGNVSGTPTVTATANAVTVITLNYDSRANTWNQENSGGGTANPPGTAGAMPQFAFYTFYINSGTVYARNNSTGAIDFSGTDAAAVINSVLTANATVGGTLYFKNGVYPLNSFTNETATGCSTFTSDSKPLAYAIGIPSNTPYSSSVDWHFVGEGNIAFEGEGTSSSPSITGVIFNVTSAAISAATSGAFLNVIFQRPASSCTLTASGPNISNNDYFSNLDVRFPTNQRGNEAGLNVWFAAMQGKDNVTADFAQGATFFQSNQPVAGTYGSFGMTSTVSGSGNWQDDTNTYAEGYDICYDWESELLTLNHPTSIYCNYAAEIGRAGNAVFHPSIINYFTDQENLNGILLGPQMTQGGRLDIFELDMEFGASGWYARTAAKMVETNVGYTSGIITYGAVLQGTGIVAEVPGNQLFTSGGSNFQSFEGSQAPNIATVPAVDSFTRANSTSLGPAWVNFSSGATAGKPCSATNFGFGITSNSATSGAGGGGCDYLASTSGPDQFSKATLNTVDASGAWVVIRSNVTPSANYYAYECSTTTGRKIIKSIAGTPTTLASTASNCAAAATIELLAVGSNLFGYYNGALDLVVSDSSVTSGFPGIAAIATTDSLTNWSGGSLPFRDATRSLYSLPAIHPTYNTLSNCNPGSSVSPTACGSAPSGTVVVPTTTATYTVNTTAVTANSRILIHAITDNSGLTGAPTCTAPPTPFVAFESARVAGTSFTFTLPSTTGASCWTYNIVN